MSDGTLTLECDAREFAEALAAYVKVGGKNYQDAVTTKTRDACFRAAQFCKKASWATIRRKFTPRYIAKALRRSKGTMTWGAYVRTTTGRVRFRLRYYSREEARKYGAALQKRTHRSVGFLKAYLAGCGEYIAIHNGLRGKRSARSKIRLANDTHFHLSMQAPKGDDGTYTLAFGSEYGYSKKKRPGTVASAILVESMQKGLDFVAGDMMDYVEKKLDEQNRLFSAQG